LYLKGKMKKLIELKNLVKTYNLGKPNEFTALKGIDLTIKKSEFVAIMGPSGSGKSTLMNILGALDILTTGSYKLNGVEVSSLSDDELADFRGKTVGFVFQQFNLLPRYSLYENVLLPTIYHSVQNPDNKIKELIKKVGLTEKMLSKPNQISGGQIQRVAIARSLVMSPSIIMADEPTGNLDSRTAYEIMEIFEGINNEGNTIILITHEEDIANYAKRIIRLKDGLIYSDEINKKRKTYIKINE